MTTMHNDRGRIDLDEPVPYTLTPRGCAALVDEPRPVEAADYVIPMCPGDDPGADWREMGWDSHANAVLAHVAWCPNHPGYWKNGAAVMWEIFLQQLDPDEPVPLALTRYGHAALVDEPGPVEAVPLVNGPADEWACETCQDAYFGARPDDGLCVSCRGGVQ